MKITKPNPTTLVVRHNKRQRLLLAGLGLLLAGLLLAAFLNRRPLDLAQFQTPTLLLYQQAGDPALEGEVEGETTARTGFRLTRYVGALLLARERLWFTLAMVGIAAGAIIILGPHWGSTITFDQSRQQVTVKRPRWFFRSDVSHYPYRDVAEVRAERDRVKGRAPNDYGLVLVVSQHEGAPLSKNYIHYKTVIPLSESYQYDRATAQTRAHQIKAFMATTPSRQSVMEAT